MEIVFSKITYSKRQFLRKSLYQKGQGKTFNVSMSLSCLASTTI